MAIEKGALTILIPDIEGWAIVKYHHSRKAHEIYSEHITGCDHAFDGAIALWSWQAQDAVVGKENACWTCGRRVPDSIVALVALAEWE